MADFLSINTLIGRPALRPRAARRGAESRDVRDHMPVRALLNFIPAPEALDELIRRARAALRKGFYWDRGSILNIVL